MFYKLTPRSGVKKIPAMGLQATWSIHGGLILVCRCATSRSGEFFLEFLCDRKRLFFGLDASFRLLVVCFNLDITYTTRTLSIFADMV